MGPGPLSACGGAVPTRAGGRAGAGQLSPPGSAAAVHFRLLISGGSFRLSDCLVFFFRDYIFVRTGLGFCFVLVFCFVFLFGDRAALRLRRGWGRGVSTAAGTGARCPPEPARSR